MRASIDFGLCLGRRSFFLLGWREGGLTIYMFTSREPFLGFFCLLSLLLGSMGEEDVLYIDSLWGEGGGLLCMVDGLMGWRLILFDFDRVM